VGASCAGDDCFSQKSCSICKATGCKWCGKAQSCEALYSWTCGLSSECFPNEVCVRKEPEYIGYAPAPDAVSFGALVVFLTVAIIVACNLLICWRGRSVFTRIQQDRQPFDETSRLLDPLVRAIFSCTTCLCSTFLIGAGLLCLAVVLWWPQPPQVSVCNAEVMWKDTLTMIVKSAFIKTNVELETLISVYNPNRLNARIRDVSGDFFYKGNHVASIAIGQIDAPGGYVSDKLGVLTFSGFDQAVDMLYDMNINQQLILTSKVSTSFDVLFGTYSLFSLSTTLPEFEIDANKPPERSHCRCRGSPS